LRVDVDLDEDETWVLVLHLGEVRSDHLAWPAPSRPEVDNDRLVAVNLISQLGSRKRTCKLTRVLNSSYDEISLTIVFILIVRLDL